MPDGAGRSFTFLEQAARDDLIGLGSQLKWLRELKERGASIFKKIGSFNENLFWMEDIDFCIRLNKMGYNVYYYPLTLLWMR